MPMAYKVRSSSLPLLPKGAKPIKVLHFSDLHLHPRKKREIADIKTFIDLKPDLVISTGDFLAHKDGIDIALNALDELLDLPGLFVFGSNDYYAPKFKNPFSYLRKDHGERRLGEKLPWQRLQKQFEEFYQSLADQNKGENNGRHNNQSPLWRSLRNWKSGRIPGIRSK